MVVGVKSPVSLLAGNTWPMEACATGGDDDNYDDGLDFVVLVFPVYNNGPHHIGYSKSFSHCWQIY